MLPKLLLCKCSLSNSVAWCALVTYILLVWFLAAFLKLLCTHRLYSTVHCYSFLCSVFLSLQVSPDLCFYYHTACGLYKGLLQVLASSAVNHDLCTFPFIIKSDTIMLPINLRPTKFGIPGLFWLPGLNKQSSNPLGCLTVFLVCHFIEFIAFLPWLILCKVRARTILSVALYLTIWVLLLLVLSDLSRLGYVKDSVYFLQPLL